MKHLKHTGTPILQFSNLLHFQQIIHFSSTRNGGVSKNNFRSFNLGNEPSYSKINRQQNYGILANATEVEQQAFCLLKQDHGTKIKVIEPGEPAGTDKLFNGYDALITNARNKCLVVRTADCVPLLLFDPEKMVIAAIHAGWRGTAKKIGQKTVRLMMDQYGCNPASILAGIGPSISPEVYEVSLDVYQRFKSETWNCRPVFRKSAKSGKYLLDLWKANQLQLEEIGMPSGNIEIAGICTFSHPELFFSARRDGIESGRMATGIMLK